jgi:hypothetical protein
MQMVLEFKQQHGYRVEDKDLLILIQVKQNIMMELIGHQEGLLPQIQEQDVFLDHKQLHG